MYSTSTLRWAGSNRVTIPSFSKILSPITYLSRRYEVKVFKLRNIYWASGFTPLVRLHWRYAGRFSLMGQVGCYKEKKINRYEIILKT